MANNINHPEEDSITKKAIEDKDSFKITVDIPVYVKSAMEEIKKSFQEKMSYGKVITLWYNTIVENKKLIAERDNLITKLSKQITDLLSRLKEVDDTWKWPVKREAVTSLKNTVLFAGSF